MEEVKPQGNVALAKSMIPEGYRLLGPNELIENEDMFFSGLEKRFMPVRTQITMHGPAFPYIAIIRPLDWISDADYRDEAKRIYGEVAEIGDRAKVEQVDFPDAKGAWITARIFIERTDEFEARIKEKYGSEESPTNAPG